MLLFPAGVTTDPPTSPTDPGVTTTTSAMETTRAPIPVPGGTCTCSVSTIHSTLFQKLRSLHEIWLDETTTSSNAACHTGFVSVVEGYHILDGLQIADDVTEQQCLDACLMFSMCLAVDYNIATKECFAHNTSSYCSEPTAKPVCRHYKRAPCIEGIFLVTRAV